jgi:hypothetical protein
MKLTAGELRKELAPARASASARSVAEIFNAPSSSAAPGGHCGHAPLAYRQPAFLAPFYLLSGHAF